MISQPQLFLFVILNKNPFSYLDILLSIGTSDTLALARVTIDFLMGGDDTVIDKKLLQKIKDIESFSEEEKTKIYDLIDMAIGYHKGKKVYS
ncbi:hypothetical protein [uncultured Aquimarina sp.]|uniref:hypothetical protein n=1 Tax=uncultured Aquimarina sp. TaxID=575652 RepID=UPI00262252D1|nr:hypothetical protein [uncultured Aquimarina sp.]